MGGRTRPEEFTEGWGGRAASPVGPEGAPPDGGGVSAGGKGTCGVGTPGTSGAWTAEGAGTARDGAAGGVVAVGDDGAVGGVVAAGGETGGGVGAGRFDTAGGVVAAGDVGAAGEETAGEATGAGPDDWTASPEGEEETGAPWVFVPARGAGMQPSGQTGSRNKSLWPCTVFGARALPLAPAVFLPAALFFTELFPELAALTLPVPETLGLACSASAKACVRAAYCFHRGSA
ncbi:MAG: hypothetical protein LBS65_06485 [Desulfovibrio sp.]|nr:hypothetical protein [Desulfovibrio sp.]